MQTCKNCREESDEMYKRYARSHTERWDDWVASNPIGRDVNRMEWRALAIAFLDKLNVSLYYEILNDSQYSDEAKKLFMENKTIKERIASSAP